MSQSHLRELYHRLVQRGWKVVEHPRGAASVEVLGAAAWEIRRGERGPALFIDFAGFGGMGEDIPLEESYACDVRGHSHGLYFRRVNRNRAKWLEELENFVEGLDGLRAT